MHNEDFTGMPNTKVGSIILADAVELVQVEVNGEESVVLGLSAGMTLKLVAPLPDYEVFIGDQFAVEMRPLVNNIINGVILERIDDDEKHNLNQMSFKIGRNKN